MQELTRPGWGKVRRRVFIVGIITVIFNFSLYKLCLAIFNLAAMDARMTERRSAAEAAQARMSSISMMSLPSASISADAYMSTSAEEDQEEEDQEREDQGEEDQGEEDQEEEEEEDVEEEDQEEEDQETAEAEAQETTPPEIAEIRMSGISNTHERPLQVREQSGHPPPPAYTPYAMDVHNDINAAVQARPPKRLIINAPTAIFGSHNNALLTSLQHIRSPAVVLNMLSSRPETSHLLANSEVVLNCGLNVVGNSNPVIAGMLYPRQQVQPPMRVPEQQRQYYTADDNNGIRVATRESAAQTNITSNMNFTSTGRAAVNSTPGNASHAQSAPFSQTMPANTVDSNDGADASVRSPNNNDGVGSAEDIRREANGDGFITRTATHVPQRRKNDACHQERCNVRSGVRKPIVRRSSHGRSSCEQSVPENPTSRLTRSQKKQLVTVVSIMTSFTLTET